MMYFAPQLGQSKAIGSDLLGVREFTPEVHEWLRGQLGEVFHGHNARLGLGRFNYRLRGPL